EKALEIVRLVNIEGNPFVLEKSHGQPARLGLARVKSETVVTEAERDHVGRRQKQRVGAEPIVRRHEQSEGRRRVRRNLRQNRLDIPARTSGRSPGRISAASQPALFSSARAKSTAP